MAGKKSDIGQDIHFTFDLKAGTGKIWLRRANYGGDAALKTSRGPDTMKVSAAGLPKMTDREFEKWLESVEFHGQRGLIWYYQDGQMKDHLPVEDRFKSRKCTIEGRILNWIWGGDGKTWYNITFKSEKEAVLKNLKGTVPLMIHPRGPQRR